ncbi:hypothetical protein P6166_15565 [Stenotrophomonas sp. HITSZ_GD]|uniref:hypothetical protein n=1 Tax=Stenotrophomonas sp. HITSZ_GD TaxID=3037248 RepID=UPI00240D3E26|nr:hypothetical protein [Stenotrophomonas sp. HITSZ_GD]MDG2526773.1 hypothetical protein [Stenotrophomonas sp. HITSZ_GD]
MKSFLWMVPGLLALSAPAFAADTRSLHVRLRVVDACALAPTATAGPAPARCGDGLPVARDHASSPASARLRALTPPSPQQDANEAEFTTYTF